MSRFSDPLDRASELEQQRADDSIRAAQLRAQPEQTQNADCTWPHTECRDCDNPIEPGRLAMGKIRCLICQGQWEKYLKGYHP